jgi:amino acid transporter
VNAAAVAPLRRELGVWAVAAVVVGDMLGSGIFFTPGELAAVARAPWQVYALWAISGGITLCGALTLAELASRRPRAGAPFHIIREGFGPFWAFLMIWMQVLVAGPGSIAGVAIAFGEFVTRFGSSPVTPGFSPAAWGAAAIAFFAGVNLLGVRWGGRTQIVLTMAKIAGLMGLVAGSLLLADAAGEVVRLKPDTTSSLATSSIATTSFLRVMGLGIGAVLFTYDGWIDVSYLGAEVKNPRRTLSRGLGFGVAAVTLLYLVTNSAYLRVLPLDAMRANPTTIAADVATAAFGPTGGTLLNALIILSIFGALGGLIMTLPRLYYAAAAQYAAETGAFASGFGDPRPGRSRIFGPLAGVTKRGVPAGALLFAAIAATAALLFFGTFSRIVNFFVVPLQLANVLMVATVFRLPRTPDDPNVFRAPGYPVVPLVFITAIGAFLASAIVFRPHETLIGVGLTMTGLPAYLWMRRRDG